MVESTGLVALGEIQDILLNVGAVAGFAAIVALAVLSMLYFSQARDVRRLREWAGREPERAAEVELRAQQIASQAIAQAYQSMSVRQSEAAAAAGIAQDQGVEVAEPLEVGEAVGSEVAGEEAPSTETVAAEGEIEGEAEAEPAQEGEQAEVPDAEQVDAGDTVVHPAPVADEALEVEGKDPDGQQPPAETDGEPAPASDGEQEDRPSRLAPSTPAAARSGAPLPPLPPLDTSEFQPVGQAPIPQIPDHYLASEATGSGHFEAIAPAETGRSRVPIAVAGVLVAVFAVVLIGTQLVGRDSSDDAQTRTEARQERDAKGTSTGERNQQVNRPAVTISVLNGTPTSGLAKLAGDALIKAEFTDVTTGNRNDNENHTTSTVYFAPGSKIEAEEVAKELAIKDVKEADEEILAAGGSVPVIVVLGADFDQ